MWGGATAAILLFPGLVGLIITAAYAMGAIAGAGRSLPQRKEDDFDGFVQCLGGFGSAFWCTPTTIIRKSHLEKTFAEVWSVI